jgi:hypothetical protein
VNGHRAKVEASQPVPLESSATVQLSEERDDDEQSRGRSGNGRFKPSRPRVQTTTNPSTDVHIEGSLINFEDPSGGQSTPRGKAALTERLKVPRRQTISLEGKGPDPVVPSYSVIKSHVDVSSRVDIHIGGLPKVKLNKFCSNPVSESFK